MKLPLATGFLCSASFLAAIIVHPDQLFIGLFLGLGLALLCMTVASFLKQLTL